MLIKNQPGQWTINKCLAQNNKKIRNIISPLVKNEENKGYESSRFSNGEIKKILLFGNKYF